MLGLVVCGLRTWTCTMAAPALAASIDERAICSGVTGTAGLRPGVSAEPVTAHEMITLRCMVSGYSPPQRRCPEGSATALSHLARKGRGRSRSDRVRVSARAPMDGPPPVACGHVLPLSGGGHKIAVLKTATTTSERRAFIRRRLIVV